ncbi:MAG: BlaI/MecI/CopY family transcriptional regulator [Solirubrobacterales bacterium]|nr:BlaI/MecI/CopY family transcriptional regulator [Solirubrobacterales bacterium]
MSERERNRRPAGALEAEVLAALWAADRPLTPAAVQEQLGRALAYTTVMTTLARLHEKGAVGRQKLGRAFAYTPLLDEAGIAAARMRELLGSGGEREAVLARFVGSLSQEEEEVLAELLQETRTEGSERQ